MNADHSILDRMPVGAFVVARDLTIEYWNPCMEDWTGIRRAEAVGRRLTDFYPVFGERRYQARFESVFEQGTPVILTYRLHGNLFPNRDASCMDRVYHTSVTCLDCDARTALFTVEDRTEVSNRIKEAREELGRRVGTEKLLRAALEAKDILFKEIHHRVKNNLNTIISLIHLQTDSIDDEPTRAHLRDLESRIQSFSLLHETLYRQDVYDSIDAAEYLDAVASSLRRSAGRESVSCALRLSPAVMSVKRALYLGLALVELMTNAMKYGASADGQTRIDVSLTLEAGGSGELRVRDHGGGIAEADASGTKDSLGIRLVRMMADELDGEIHFEAPAGGGTLAVLGFSTDSVPSG